MDIFFEKNLTLLIPNAKFQEELLQKNIAIIGAGGLGHNLLMQCSGLGVGAIDLWDFDVVSEGNLQRQLLYRYDDLGKSKALCAIREASRLNPHIKLKAKEEKIADNNIHQLQNYDLVFDCTDAFETKILLADFFYAVKRPYVFASAYNIYGQVFLYRPEGGHCLRCMQEFMPMPPRKSEHTGTLGLTATLTSTLQALAGVQFLTRNGLDEWENILLYCDLMRVLTKKITITHRCSRCSKSEVL